MDSSTPIRSAPQPSDDKATTRDVASAVQPRTASVTKLSVSLSSCPSTTSSLSPPASSVFKSSLHSDHDGINGKSATKRRPLANGMSFKQQQQCSVDEDTFDSHRRRPNNNAGGGGVQSHPHRCTLKIRFVWYITDSNRSATQKTRKMNI